MFVSELCEEDSANMCEQTKQVPISHGLSGITVLNNLKMIEMTTQIKEGGLYISQNPNIIFSDTSVLTVKECEVNCKQLII